MGNAKETVNRFINDAVNGRNRQAFDEVLAEDFLLWPPELGVGPDELWAVLDYYFAAFPDLHYAMEEQVAEGDTVVARLRMTGTHRGEYGGKIGTGATFAVDEVDIFKIFDGRITTYRITWDELGFRTQLGLPSHT